MPTEIVDASVMEVEAVVDEEEEDDDDEEALMEVEATIDEEDDDDEDEIDEVEADQSVATGEDEEDDDNDVLASAVVVDAEIDEDDDDDDPDDDSDDGVVSVVVEAEPLEAAKSNAPLATAKVLAAAAPMATVVTSSKKGPAPQSKVSATKASNSKKTASTTNSSKHSGKTSPKSVVSVDPSLAERLYKSVPPSKLAAARDARANLQDTVPTLPFSIAETQVRSFGRLCIQSLPPTVAGASKTDKAKTPQRGKFHTTSAIYPVGYSCDRYDFSPVHGRILKIRCSILSGESIKVTQTKGGFPVQTELTDGPIFRIMWGRGVDEDAADEKVDYPFDPFTHSRPIFMTGSSESDAALKDSVKSKRMPVLPVVGMRVKVRYDKEKHFTGAITSVGEPRAVTNGKKKRTRVEVVVKYDDGVVEKMTHPDPDLTLLMPGSENEIDRYGGVELREINGSPVTSVVGESPLQAWGRALQKLGLIDEIMFECAIESVEQARLDGMREAKDKLDGRSRGSSISRRNEDADSRAASPVPSSINNDDDGRDVKMEGVDESDREPPSEEEQLLRAKVDSLMADLESAKEEDKTATLELANARIQDLGPFLCNPFHDDDEMWKSQEASWLSIAVRKEKTKMGSMGNKRKIVTAVDLLERNDTFFNSDIDALIEGLPGSEFSDPYVFQAFRSSGSGGVKRDWMHEAQVRNEKEVQQRIQRSVEIQVKEEHDQEKDKKRKQRDDDRDSRKRQKLTEEDVRKKARADERLARLEVQINERLYKEAAFQREKVVVILARNLSREFARRRKAAEILSAQGILDGIHSVKPEHKLDQVGALPKPTNVFNEDAVRVWNFMATFQSFFLQRGYVKTIPTLKSLQGAVDCLNGKRTDRSMTDSDAVVKLTDLSVALCKPLAASLTRSLFASLIALNPALQKDFGAAFFHGVNATASSEVKGEFRDEDLAVASSDCLLPVNSMTWQEVARLAFLSDALGELGQSKHEAAHLLRGYRSAGHPNSKESRRLRKTEDFAIAILRQQLSENRFSSEASAVGRNRCWVDTPCSPVNADSSIDDPVLESEASPERRRDSVGLLDCLSFSNEEYTKLEHARARYMDDALVLKDEMERQKLKDADEEDDDDDDDDDDDEQASTPGKKGKGDKKSSSKRLSKTGSSVSDSDTVQPAIAADPMDVCKVSPGENQKLGKETPYDDFCADRVGAPEVLRRCLAVLRTLAVSGPAEPFLYPVDPQSNPGYYDMILRPMSLRKVGLDLYDAIEKVENDCEDIDAHLEEVVVRFGRSVRLIEQNCVTYTNAGPMVVAAGSELLRLFERLFFDWVLAPEHLLPDLELLDDDKCVEPHPSDSDQHATVILCDGCEGKWNTVRLDPPLIDIPKGDWYCPRCLSGRWYGTIDPRLGKCVRKAQPSTTRPGASIGVGVVTSCVYSYPESGAGKASLVYLVKYEDGSNDRWSLSEIDQALVAANTPVPPIRWLSAVVESPGYGFGVDSGLRRDVIPPPLNPNVSDTAGKVANSSSVFRDTITTAGTLLITDPRDMTAAEWLRLLVLLVMKCSSSDAIQNVVSAMENEAAINIAASLETVKKVTQTKIKEILPEICGGDIVELTMADFALVKADDDTDMQVSPSVPRNVQPIDGTGTPVGKPSITVLGSDAVPLVEETKTDPTVAGDASCGEVPSVPVAPDLRFAWALAEKARRQKSIEESFAAFCIKEQMKPTVASFEDDGFSTVVDSSMSSKESGLSFSTLRCRSSICKFCGLTDVALGLPLVRVPDEDEWDSLFPHAARNCRPYLVAEIPTTTSNKSKLAAVTIRLEGELFSCSESWLEEIKDGGMLEFTPRSELGFQNDLRFRYESGLPFICGSISAHESCAFAVHNARKEKAVQRYKVNQADLIEKEAGMSCGRTLEIGRDNVGRSYWKFDSDPTSLFACIESPMGSESVASGSWYYYQHPESIASVIVSLGKLPIAKELRRSYPAANQMIRDGSWTELVMKRAFPNAISAYTGLRSSKGTTGKVEKSHRVGDEVLVQSKSAGLYWNASVVALSEGLLDDSGHGDIVNAYRVQYVKWSARYNEWVRSDRVLEVNEQTRVLQEEALNERSMAVCGLPTILNVLYANEFLHAKERARGSTILPDFALIAQPTSQCPSLSESTFATVKAALLAIEAALPVGCVDTRDTGPWRPEVAAQWRSIVVGVVGPVALMQCVIVLEDAISEEWMKDDVSHLRSCLPARWKAIAEASCASLAIRVILLDRAIIYNNIDAKRFNAKKKRQK